jgi:hypothetical protein
LQKVNEATVLTQAAKTMGEGRNSLMSSHITTASTTKKVGGGVAQDISTLRGSAAEISWNF